MKCARLTVLLLLSLLLIQTCATTAPAKHSKPVAKAQHITWPRPVISKARSRDGKIVAVYDRTGFYIADGSGKHRRKLSISLDGLDRDMTSVTFSFNGAGAILAVMAVDWSGEPAVCSYEVLWSVDAKTGHVRQVNEWNANLLGAGWREADHRLGAWSSDGKSIQIIADSYYLTDGAADMEYRGLVGLWVNMTHRPAKKPAKK